MRVIVVWQGGGALGAYAAGVWRALVPRLQARGARLVGVAGASIGAINAAVIARHHADPDWGVAALEAFWRERIATPSFPFTGALAWMPPWSDAARAWDGLMTGLLIGNRGLYQALPLNWNPLAGLQRIRRPLLDRSRMLATLEEVVGRYPSEPGMPWLGVAATDVLAGELRLYGSDEGEVSPLHLAASAAIPLFFEPVEIDGRLLWDGDMIRRSMLQPVIERVAAREAPATADDPLVCISIELMPRSVAQAPVSGAAIMARVSHIQQAGKLTTEEGPARLPEGWQALHLSRGALPNDGVSNQFDYSPRRIAQLIEQGEREAAQAWSHWTGEPLDDAEPAAPAGRPQAADPGARDEAIASRGAAAAAAQAGETVEAGQASDAGEAVDSPPGQADREDAPPLTTPATAPAAAQPPAQPAQAASDGALAASRPQPASERPARRTRRVAVEVQPEQPASHGADHPAAEAEPAPTDPVAEAVREVLGDSVPPEPLASPEVTGTVH